MLDTGYTVTVYDLLPGNAEYALNSIANVKTSASAAVEIGDYVSNNTHTVRVVHNYGECNM
jgi:hypothetical protein